jgi:hypothetical protein
LQKLKTANTLNQKALGTTGHKWKTADIGHPRLAMDCYINMQTHWVHLLIREDTQLKETFQKPEAKFTFGTVINLFYTPKTQLKLKHTLSTVQQVAMASFPSQDTSCTPCNLAFKGTMIKPSLMKIHYCVQNLIRRTETHKYDGMILSLTIHGCATNYLNK